MAQDPVCARSAPGSGRMRDAADALERHLRHAGAAAATRLDGITVVVDQANGAASYAPRAHHAAGARVIAINAEPDGLNINDGCGSTHLEQLQVAVLAHRADLGWPTTGTPTAAQPSTPLDRWSTATRSWWCWRWPCTSRRTGLQHTGRHRDEHRGLHLAMREAGITVITTGSATGTCSRRCGPVNTPRR